MLQAGVNLKGPGYRNGKEIEMPANFFGKFLLQENALTIDQLESALAHQEQNNRPIGELAVGSGYMTSAQVEQVIGAQRRSRLRFGQLAVEMKMLSRSQLEKLLLSQSQNRYFLGEALVDLKILKSETVDGYLKAFTKAQQDKKDQLGQALASMAEKDCLVVLMEVVVEYFNRMGCRVKIDGLLSHSPANGWNDGHMFFADHIIDQAGHSFSLMFPAASFDRITGTFLNRQGQQFTSEEKNDFLDQMVFNINYIFCRELSSQGRNCRCGASGSVKTGHRIIAIIKIDTVYQVSVYLGYYG